MAENFDLDPIRERLRAKLDEAGISMRAASLAADLAPGYVHAFVKAGTEPTISRLAEICRANNVSLAYVMFGFEMSEDTRRALELIQDDPQKLNALLQLLER